VSLVGLASVELPRRRRPRRWARIPCRSGRSPGRNAVQSASC